MNLASRLEGLTRTYGARILVSDETRLALHDADEFLLREVDTVRVKGRRQPCVLYEVCAALPEPQRLARQASMAEYNRARNLMRDGRFAEAETALAAVIAADPDDGVAAVHLGRAREWRERPLAAWDGVVDMAHK